MQIHAERRWGRREQAIAAGRKSGLNAEAKRKAAARCKAALLRLRPMREDCREMLDDIDREIAAQETLLRECERERSGLIRGKGMA